MKSAKGKVLRLQPRKQELQSATIEAMEEMLAKAKSGELTAFVSVALDAGYALWVVRSRMTARQRMNIIGQIEYLKWLLIEDEANER